MRSLKNFPCLLLYMVLWVSFLAQAAIRMYYIGIVEENWDYAPTGRNQITGQNLTEDEEAMVYVRQEANRIGRVYKKAIFKQFTDSTYSQEITKPSWLGFLGPVLRAEERDTFIIHLKNFASRPYSIHPHGVFYKKDSEGALYPDGTGRKSKEDDFVLPGTNYTYTWVVTDDFAPTPTDPQCLTWIYHSHIDTPKDISTGLIGPLLVCKKGSLDNTSGLVANFTDGYALMFSIIDENLSWYLDENINTFCLDPSTVDKDDEDFQLSNKMHAINGYIFGNLPGLEMCAGELVSWHMFGMGSEADIHSVHFFDHTFDQRGHRADVVSLFPATFVTVEMKVENVGEWLLTCQVNEHIKAGMMGLYNIKACNQNIAEPSQTGQKRRYFIAAERILWDYGPSGVDKETGKALNATGSDSSLFFTRGDDRVGGQYWKARYVSYTDGTFTRKQEAPEAAVHLGLLGPVIKAEVGDTIMVTFANKADKNYSMMPHGVAFSKTSEGAPYADGHEKPGACVQPGEIFEYKWRVPQSVGPTDSDPPCLTYLYHSATDPVMDTQSGLVGPLIICKKDSLEPDGTQKGIDKEFYLLFTVFDENLSFYLDTNINAFMAHPSVVNKMDEDFQESNKMHAINGYMFGNLPSLTMCKDDNVSWHMIGLGTETDMHGVHFQGNTIRLGGTIRDTVALFPHTSATALMQPDRVGTFQVLCRTFDHFAGGMKALYEVTPCRNRMGDGRRYGTIRTYYIAAEEVEWDYASGASQAEKMVEAMSKEESYGHVFLSQGEDLIGPKYKKVVYREYQSGEFTEQKKRTSREQHLQILGPLIHAEVGDSILIVFKNKASRPYSVSAHGIEEDDIGNKAQTTMPGEISTYRWNVPARSGPGASDPNCITWVYYSTVHFIKDIYSGLIGPLIICRKGLLNEKGFRTDVDREFALLFLIFDENESWYLNQNIEKYLNKNPKEFSRTDDFVEGNKMHAINGKIYDNLPGLTMYEGEKTNWYLIGMGNEVDLHTVHFHGASFLFKADHDHRGDVYDLFPGTFQTVELVAFNPGTWLLHCHVHDHIHAGMETTYTILQSGIEGHAVTTTEYGAITVNRKNAGKGTQMSCFSPSSFSWRQAAYVDSYCWAAVQQKQHSQSDSGHLPLWLHKFFPYILLLLAILLYLPYLFWRFTAAPHLFADLKFIMEELDKAYNRAIKAANSCYNGDARDAAGSTLVINENIAPSFWELSDSHFKYPIVEQYLKTKKSSKNLIVRYIFCRLLTLTIIVLACLYLGYYISLSTVTDEFICNIKTGILKNDTTVPERFQCKLIAVGIFQLLSYINFIVYFLLMPLVIYALLVPYRQSSDILQVYELLPTFDVLKVKTKSYDDLSLYLLFLEENVSELKSYKCLKVLENLKGNGEKFDAMQLLMNLGSIKTDALDSRSKGKKTETETANSGTELQDLAGSTLPGDGAKTSKEDGKLRQRLLDSSC